MAPHRAGGVARGDAPSEEEVRAKEEAAKAAEAVRAASATLERRVTDDAPEGEPNPTMLSRVEALGERLEEAVKEAAEAYYAALDPERAITRPDDIPPSLDEMAAKARAFGEGLLEEARAHLEAAASAARVAVVGLGDAVANAAEASVEDFLERGVERLHVAFHRATAAFAPEAKALAGRRASHKGDGPGPRAGPRRAELDALAEDEGAFARGGGSAREGGGDGRGGGRGGGEGVGGELCAARGCSRRWRAISSPRGTSSRTAPAPPPSPRSRGKTSSSSAASDTRRRAAEANRPSAGTSRPARGRTRSARGRPSTSTASRRRRAATPSSTSPRSPRIPRRRTEAPSGRRQGAEDAEGAEVAEAPGAPRAPMAATRPRTRRVPRRTTACGGTRSTPGRSTGIGRPAVSRDVSRARPRGDAFVKATEETFRAHAEGMERRLRRRRRSRRRGSARREGEGGGRGGVGRGG